MRTGTRRTPTLLFTLALVATLLPVAMATPSDAQPPFVVPEDGPPGISSRKVLTIGLDGVNVDDMLEHADTPHIAALIADGVVSRSQFYAPPVAATLSGPGWSTLGTGVWPDKHGVVDNSFVGKNYDEYPDWLTRAEQVNPAYSTFAISDWGPVGTTQGNGPIYSALIDVNLGFEADDYGGYDAGDQLVADTTADWLLEEDSDALFVYFGEPDIAAHTYGAGPGAPEYIDAIEDADSRIGQLLDAIEARPTFAAEDWLVLITTDHGHVIPHGGHGGGSLLERTTFVVASGGDVPSGGPVRRIEMVDPPVTALAHIGVAIDPAWNLDGVVVGSESTDPFDTVADALQPAVDENIDPSILGWTHNPPDGWTIETSDAMTGLGVTEWRGWSFTTEDFWTAADTQQRETYLRRRDVFAVADPDEWHDLGSPSVPFDSTLISPEYGVTGGDTAVIGFESHYRQEDDQLAQVLVSFDGGADVEVLRYGPDAADDNGGADVPNATVRLDVPVPAGATSMTVKWRLSQAGNDWFWAIDAPEITSEDSPGGGPFTLTLTKAGSGSGTVTSSPAGIKCGADCAESYASGTSVTLTAKASRGATFTGWSGACTGTGSCVVSMTVARGVTATFDTGGGSTFTLSVTKAGSGSGTVTSSPKGIKCGADCSESYASGTSVTLPAKAARGSTFTGWSGACTGTASCAVSMTVARGDRHLH